MALAQLRTFAAPIDLVEGVNSTILLVTNSDSPSQNISMTTVYCTKGHENQDSNRFCQICGEKLNPPVLPNNLMPGNILEDRYRIVQQIGQGGFGRTYLCENLTRFNEPCVLKEFAPQVQGTYALDKAKKLFEREASVLHNLAHPQIPRFRELFELKTGSHGLFLVQDYVAGQTYRYLLAARQNHNRLFSEAEVRQLLIDTLPVLEYIHSLGVIHRDIAPDNLMLRSSDNLPVLIDFGGVKQIAVNAEIQATGNTEVPTCLGKVGYAPHEQMQRGTVSANSDLYALAATSLVLLTGKEPTELIDPQSLTWNWRSTINLESNLGMLFDRMLQPNPASRYQSASEVLSILKQQVAVPQPVTLPPAQPHNSAVGTVVISPGVKQKQVNTSPLVATGNDSSFLTILGRSWVGILGLGTVGAVAWAGSSIFNKPNTPTPPIISTPSTPASSTAPITEATPNGSPSPNGTSRNTNANSTSTDNDSSGASSSSSSNASKVIIKSSPNNETSKGSVAASPDSNRVTNSRKSSRDASADSSSSRTDTQRERVRRNAGTTPTVRRNNSTEEEPTFKAPKIEEYDSKPRASKAPSEDKPVSKPSKVEEFDVKPRSSKPVSEDKPAAKSPKVEEFDVKPRRQSASKPESPAQNSKKPAKKSETGGEENEQLF